MSTAVLRGHRQLRLGIGPFAGVAPSLVLAGAWFGAAVVWGVTGALPGGRWAVVHLFTLGVLTNLLVGFTQHFGRSITRHDAALGTGAVLLLNLGAIGTVAGMLAGLPALLAVGALVVAGTVALARLRLGRMRAAAPTTRFAEVVEAYQRAHEAFIVAAAIGASLGAGLVPGGWHAGARLAHLHLNLLGWTGLVVLATAVFFGPAMLRVRLPQGAERGALWTIRLASGGLVLTAVALAVPSGSAAGGLARFVSVAGLLAYATGVAVVAALVTELARSAHPSAVRLLLPAALWWFLIATLADAAALALDAPGLQPALGLALGLGVFLQLILAVGLYLLPSLRGRDFAARDALIARSERGAGLRAALLNAGVATAAITAAIPGAPVVATALAWAVVLGVVAATAVIAIAPVRPDPTVARSSVARRYRTPQGDPPGGQA